MTAALELLAERADELPVRTKHKDRRVLLQVRLTFVHDVQIVLAVHRDVMSSLPFVVVRQLWVVVADLIAKFAFADDDVPFADSRPRADDGGDPSGG